MLNVGVPRADVCGLAGGIIERWKIRAGRVIELPLPIWGDEMNHTASPNGEEYSLWNDFSSVTSYTKRIPIAPR